MCKSIGLYVHIPFCMSKCNYCDFFSVKSTFDNMDKYVDHMCRLLKTYGSRLHTGVDTIYFGGGTPSVMGTDRLLRIINTIYSSFEVENNCEITIEVNPKSGKVLDFKALSSSGVNRVSLGVQSVNKNELKILGRLHCNDDVDNTVQQIRNAGIDNVSLDLMIGIPEQTVDSLEKSIVFCDTLNPRHISAYILKVEENTPFYKNKEKLNLPNEDRQIEFYEYMCKRLDSLGYAQYEISNFAKADWKSKHNLKYWNAEEYLGLGPGAHSFIKGKRFYFNRCFSDFFNNITVDDGGGGDEEEYAMMRLRLSVGLREDEYKKRFGHSIPPVYYNRCFKFKNAGLLDYNNKGIWFTSKGFLVSNTLIADIIY
ncbi:MAG TPA: radical SAM family heme chaperone HemW [Clostridiales bacterium]|nr:radical SAM family heme chaperone HemW [Clostridiales bacterium]